ncbi:glycosyltransferase 87 family protein [Cryobacterium sp. MLB-32]|uniref:glycosyltransferase 87 family protein n=1 Tax=Cryobacterium sp. MLB-32 TaxID=1529318 RepID=UPI0009DD205D|nr:glycosyltransferase 87 family protein [Cryobacterium sp. MLB-32]
MSFVVGQLDRIVLDALTPERRLRLQSRRSLMGGFVTLHTIFLFAMLPTILTGRVLGDLPLYRIWAELGFNHGVWQGINVEWVYPIGALLPIALAGVAGPLLYQLLWFLMTVALNAVAVAALTSGGRRRSGYKAAWVWLLLSFILSPVGLLRLEGLTAPLVIAGLVFLATRPVLAGVLLSVATWIKVWPAAVLLAVVAASRQRVTVILAGAAVTSLVAAFVWLMGGLQFLTGFVTMQSDRALQLEAPVTTPWVWLAAIGHQRTTIYENLAISTREVSGPGTSFMAAMMTPVMFAALLAIFVLMLCALRRRTTDASALLLIGALALVGAFVIFNKVGSPQYMLWIAPIVAVGVAQDWWRWRVPAYLMVLIAILTTLVFPVFYLPLIDGDPFAVLLLTGRNALLIVLFGWSVRVLWSLALGRTAVVVPARTLTLQRELRLD